MGQLFKALQVIENAGIFEKKIVTLDTNDLPKNDLLIKVNYSSVNYKDALSASGNRGVSRKFPHVPGIDAVGEVISTLSDKFKENDRVIVTGYDLGMNTWGGFARYISVPEAWALPVPDEMTDKEAMSLGTAGLTAGLSVHHLINSRILPQNGKVIVSGASGGVGSIAVSILSQLGYHVVAITGKQDHLFLYDYLGASEVIDRNTFIANYDRKPIAESHFSAGIDTLSGPILSGILKSIKYGGVVTCCGLVASPELNTSVFPFILRAIRLIGVDSAELSIPERMMIWNKLSKEWKPANMEKITKEIYLEGLPEQLDISLAGKAIGRVVLKHQG